MHNRTLLKLTSYLAVLRMKKTFILYQIPLLLLSVYLSVGGCSKKTALRAEKSIESPKREFRAAWVATVDNIDWPSNKNLATNVQKAEFIRILDRHQELGMNAAMVQVRAAADAFYARSTEPWSEWLTGVQGESPDPYYDPMAFMIEESHKRNIEFHAWLNLSRGTHKASKSIADNHITKTHPEWFFTYDKHMLFNLGIPEVREYIVDIVRNIAKFYNVDGIHFDDYFYPYTVVGQRIDDDAAFRKYGQGFTNVDDWRRYNVDETIKGIAAVIKGEKPRVKFGISPFSVWRNASVDPLGSQTQGGQTSYDNLYADTRKWFREGLIDYIAPQIYFTIEFDKVPYQTMTDWWVKQSDQRHIYIGHGTYRVGNTDRDKAWALPNQIPRQVRYNRSKKGINGSIFYNTTSLFRNSLGVADSLKYLNQYVALTPTMPWKDNVPPNAPQNVTAKRASDIGIVVTWKTPKISARDDEPIHKWVIYRFETGELMNLENTKNIVVIMPNTGLVNYLDNTTRKDKSYVYLVTALDRLQNESAPSNQVQVK